MHIMVTQNYPIRDTFNKNNKYLSSQPTMGDGRSVVSIASNVSVCSKLGAKEQIIWLMILRIDLGTVKKLGTEESMEYRD